MSINQLYRQQEKIACLTAYDASFASLVEQANIDVVLVGDSLGSVIQGKKDTLGVSMRDMLYHSACVRGVIKHSVLMSDMPFLSYTTPKKALKNAGKFLRLGVDIVKLEGDKTLVPIVRCLVDNYIPVCAHIGLKPQQSRQLGGYYVHGKTAQSKQQLLDDANALVEAGASVILLECVEPEVAAEITTTIDVPTIGIGSGSACDGQILVLYDVLGISHNLPPFSKNFLNESTSVLEAFKAYSVAVKSKQFP
jgi:3-methyl-2-oxobutanoate hydroxymethyltransferase